MIDYVDVMINEVLCRFKRQYELRTDCMEEVFDNCEDIDMAYKHYPRQWISITDYGTPCKSFASYELKHPNYDDFEDMDDFLISVYNVIDFLTILGRYIGIKSEVFEEGEEFLRKTLNWGATDDNFL